MYNDHTFKDKKHCKDCWQKYKEMLPRIGDFPVDKMINDLRSMENTPLSDKPNLRELVDKHFNEIKAAAHVDKYGKIIKNGKSIGRILDQKVALHGGKSIHAADPKFFDEIDRAINGK